MTALSTHIASNASTAAALADLAGSMAGATRDASLGFVFFGASHDADDVAAWVARHLPGVPFIGGTSCRGVLVGGHQPDPSDIAVLLIHDRGGDYGVGAAALGDNPAAAAAQALEDALDAAGCPGELPDAVWVFQPPGAEEQVIEGLRRVIGDRCPVLGGSAADDMVTGAWRQIASVPAEGPSVVVAVLLPSTPIATTFQSGYAPTGRSGIVTAATGRRIETIDGEPAADVYNRWADGALAGKLGGGTVLAETSLGPLGIAMREVGGIVQHRLIHPAAFTADHAIEAFAEVEVGARIELMTGSADGLARRAGRVLHDSTAYLPPGAAYAGGLMVYCGGCMMAVGDALPTLVAGVDEAVGNKPVLGVFTFGEQGPIGEACVHGNLMVSALAFAE